MSDKDQHLDSQEAEAADAVNAVGAAHPLKNELWEWAKALLLAIGLVLVIRWLLFAPFIVEGPSMEPNFHTGERLIVNKLIYDLRVPQRGEVVVFKATESKDFIKRVVGLPGESVKVEGDKVYVNGTPIEEPYLKEALDAAAKNGTSYNTRTNYKEQEVPAGSLFVMGDNRSNSFDSRDIGFIRLEDIIGRAELVFWPLPDIGLVH
jgi:signal peptidase I